jgi:hypothetical protein
MKTLYALIVASLSWQAYVNPTGTTYVALNTNEFGTPIEYVETAAVATAAIKPIDGAEFEGTSRDDAHAAYASWLSRGYDDHTASVSAPILGYSFDAGADFNVSAPAAKPILGYSFDAGADFNFRNDYAAVIGLFDDHTAAVSVDEDYGIGSDIDLYIGEDGWGP